MNRGFDKWRWVDPGRMEAGKSGLTFIELLIALALSAFLVAAAAQVFVSVLRSLEMTETGPIEIDHMDRLEDFIDYLVQHDRRRRENFGLEVSLERIPDSALEGLRFDPLDPHPFFEVDDPIPGEITAYLVFNEEEGLEVIWFRRQDGRRRGQVETRRTRLSPFVADLEFGRWDPQERTWKFERSTDVSIGDELQSPRALRLTFDFPDQTGTRWIYLQPVLRDVLLF